MSKPYMYPAKVYRSQARTALLGRWKSALIVLFVISLLSGAVFGASVTTQTDGSAQELTILELSVGPFQSSSLWQDGQLVQDAAKLTKHAGLLPYSTPLLLCALAVALLFLILQPVSLRANTHLGLDLADGKAPSMNVLRITWRDYWRTVGMEILILLCAAWPFLLAMLGAVLLAIGFQASSPLLIFPLIIAAFVLLFTRLINYFLASHLLITRPELPLRALLRESRRLMKGCRTRALLLLLSFSGWFALYVLASFVLSTSILPALPIFPLQVIIHVLLSLLTLPLSLYVNVTIAAFYRDRLRCDTMSAQE